MTPTELKLIFTLKHWVKNDMVSSTVRETSVAVLPSRSAWWKMSASVVAEPRVREAN